MSFARDAAIGAQLKSLGPCLRRRDESERPMEIEMVLKLGNHALPIQFKPRQKFAQTIGVVDHAAFAPRRVE